MMSASHAVQAATSVAAPIATIVTPPPASPLASKAMTWYFDVISPFAYLQSTQLHRLEPHACIAYKPVVFAGLLQHFGNVGPAEIAPKRQWTFEHVAWVAHRLGVPMNRPAAHPFNPVALLRTLVAAANTPAALRMVMEYIWVHSGDLSDLSALHRALQLRPAAIAAPAVKAELIANGQAAIAQGVFGVPTTVIDGKLFWGLDATEMVLAYLQGDAWFSTPAYTAAKDFPQGVQRTR
jgi:2-hydroxychromene-2-carboxylate isomerase